MKRGKGETIFLYIVWVLTIILGTLRSCDVIQWPWYCVMMPVIVYAVYVVIAIIAIGILYCITSERDRKQKKE